MNKLKQVRLALGLKQSDMAKIIDVSLPNYCKKENSQVKISLSEAKRISAYVHKPIEEIFFVEDNSAGQ